MAYFVNRSIFVHCCYCDRALIYIRRMGVPVLDSFEIDILKGVVSSDHAHLLLSAPPTMAPSEIMRRIKVV